MPARDKYHGTVKNVLVKDGWTSTHDPLMLGTGTKNLFVDLEIRGTAALSRVASEERTARLGQLRADFQAEEGTPFHHFFCPLLHAPWPPAEPPLNMSSPA